MSSRKGSGAEEADGVHSSIFAQTNAISKFLEENEELYRDDKCFGMLKSFFEIFNDQLRINFELRNKMARETAKSSFDPNGFEEIQANVSKFLRRFTTASGTDVTNLDDVYTIFSDTLERYATVMNTQDDIENTAAKIREIELEHKSKSQELTSINEKLKTSNDDSIQHANTRIEELRAKLLKLTPEVQANRTTYESRTRNKNELMRHIKERREAIEVTKQNFDERQRKRKDTKHHLKQAICDAKAARQQLLNDEQPLMKALEEAQKELETIETMSQQELKQIENQRSDVELELGSLEHQFRERVEEKRVLTSTFNGLEKKATVANEKAKQLIKGVTETKDNLASLNERMAELLVDGETPQKQLEMDTERATEMSKEIEEKQSQVEETKKQNNKLASQIRVLEDNLTGIRKSNRKMKCSVQLQESELSAVQASLNKHNRQRAGYDATLATFAELKHDLRLPSSATPEEVAQHAIALLKPTEIKLPRPHHSSVSSDLELLHRQLTQIESRMI